MNYPHFFRWRNCGSESLREFPKINQLVSGRTRMGTCIFPVLSLVVLPLIRSFLFSPLCCISSLPRVLVSSLRLVCASAYAVSSPWKVLPQCSYPSESSPSSKTPVKVSLFSDFFLAILSPHLLCSYQHILPCIFLFSQCFFVLCSELNARNLWEIEKFSSLNGSYREADVTLCC